MNYIDTHAHLNLSAFDDDREAVIARCAEEGVRVINVGTKESTSKLAVELADQHDHLYAIVGLHPIQTTPRYHSEEEVGGPAFTSKGEVFDTEFYRDLAKSKKVVGIGECGFDYYRMSEGLAEDSAGGNGLCRTERMKGASSAYWHNGAETYEIQEAAFIEQIKLANELQLPLMIHTRNPKPGETSPTGRSVYVDVYEVLNQYAQVPFNVHFYAGTWAEASQFIDIGGTISFTGVITFPAHKPGIQDYLDVVAAAPLDKIHAETDCPYVSPVPHRGQRCEPWMMKEVVATIATIKKLPEAAVHEQLWQNAQQLYRF